MEVVITVPPRRKASPRVKATSSASSDVNSDSESRPTKKRRAAHKAIVISDGDDDDELGSEDDYEPEEKSGPAGSKRKRVSKISSRSSAASPPTSDYEDSPLEESEEDEEEEDYESEEEDASEEEEMPKKSKAKAKPSVKRRGKAVSTDVSEVETSGDDAMDVDDDGEKKSTSKAKKGAKKAKSSEDEGDEGNVISKKKRREDSDPWKLKSAAVKKDWSQMKAPPLEMFHWARKVVDEYTYLDGKVLSMVTRVSADRLWVLSGTPPIHDFLALKTISGFMGIHLGVDDEGEGQASASAIKKRYNQQSGQCRFLEYILMCLLTYFNQ